MKKIKWIIISFLILSVCGYFIFRYITNYSIPDLSVNKRDFEKSIKFIGNNTQIITDGGKGYLTKNGRIWLMRLEGGNQQMGMMNGLLIAPILRKSEKQLFGMLDYYIPSKILQLGLEIFVRFNYRNLNKQIPSEYLDEIAALSQSYYDPYNSIDPTYQRILWYHTLYDMSLSIEQSQAISCTAFAAAGDATVNRNLIIGRNWDFEWGGLFDEDKIVIIFVPQNKIPFVSVSWPGHIGVITGLNREGIYVSINGARGGNINKNGVPLLLLMRKVLENSSNLQQAIEILKQSQVMIPHIVLLGDGNQKQAVIVERTPQKIEIIKMKNGILPVANHYLSEELRNDPKNLRVRYNTSTYFRYKRMSELLKKYYGKIDPRKGVDILRDKMGENDAKIPLGDRGAIDALIATHSVVVDATERKIWVSESPHTLGRYVLFDLKKLFSDPLPPESNIEFLPSDELFNSQQFESYLLVLNLIEDGKNLLDRNNIEEAIRNFNKAESIGGPNEELELLLAKAYDKFGQKSRAIEHWNNFLKFYPHTPQLRDYAKKRINN